MKTVIKKMTADCKAEVIEMMRVFYASPAVSTNGTPEIFENDFQGCIDDSPYLEGFVFEEDGLIVGYAMLAKSFSTEFGKPCVWIEDLYIKPEFRGQGIGTLFFEFVENKYKNVIFRLEVEEENKATVALYKKCGYGILPYLEMKK